MILTECPPEHDLMALLDGESVGGETVAHVERCGDCRQRLSRLKSEVGQIRKLLSGIDAKDLRTIPDLVGERAKIGRYIVVGLLDTGGQAAVYRAIHPTLNRDVVVKWSLQPAQSDQDRDLLVREGRLLADLDHPAIAHVYDLDFEEGRPFLAMEYIRGSNLETWAARETTISPGRAAEMVAEVARAADAAHELGVVHQDIKPANILVAESGKLKLIDFGMACIRRAWVESAKDGSAGGGTVCYMPPEQARGEAEKIGPPTDVFALGAVLYRLLTGNPPYRGRTSGEVLARARDCQFDRELLASSGAPRQLVGICLRAMSERPEDRYRRAAHLAEALEAWATRPRRNRRLAKVGAGVAAVVGLGAFLYVERNGFGPSPTPATQPAPTVSSETAARDLLQIVRADESLDLRSALPLLGSDLAQINFDVPRGWNWVILQVKTSGEIEQLTPEQLPAGDDKIRLRFPGKGKASRFDPTSGTEMVIAWASPNPIPLSSIRPLLQPTGPLPHLPPTQFLRLTRDEVRPVRGQKRGSDLGDASSTPLTEIQDLLERVRVELVRQNAPLVAGVAFCHEN